MSATATAPTAWRDFPPRVLRDYALLADGRRGAVVGPRGDVAWLCAPRWDSDAVFASLVGGPGVYAVTPDEPNVWGGYYEPGSLVWRSRWVTQRTVFECREALAQPADPHRLVLLRRIEAGAQDAVVRVVLQPAAGFGRHELRDLHRADDGSWTGRAGDLHLRWTGCPEARLDADGWTARVVVPAGSARELVLEISDRSLPQLLEPAAAWQTTEQWWESQVPALEGTAAPRDSRHAYAVLIGLTTPGGGTVAAATLGLPERADAGRSYDYRYVWLRDQAYVGLSAAVGEPLPLMDAAVHRVTDLLLEHGSALAPAYRVDGGTVPEETVLGLGGYPGGTDVRGNWVRGQFQLDAYGEVLQLLAAAARHDHLDAQGARAIELAVDIVARRWRDPDAGIWELDDAWWAHSRLSCVAGLRAVSALPHVPRERSAAWDHLADVVLAETSRRCLAPDGSWRRSPQHDGTDAALLLPPVRGALPADDPRTRATRERVVRELTDDGYVYRFDADGKPLGEAEGAFTMCGFTMALATAYEGDWASALRWFERTRAVCGPPGLLAEEFDVRQRQLRGNLPQAFAHAMLLETSQRLAQAGSLSPGVRQPSRVASARHTSVA